MKAASRTATTRATKTTAFAVTRRRLAAVPAARPPGTFDVAEPVFGEDGVAPPARTDVLSSLGVSGSSKPWARSSGSQPPSGAAVAGTVVVTAGSAGSTGSVGLAPVAVASARLGPAG